MKMQITRSNILLKCLGKLKWSVWSIFRFIRIRGVIKTEIQRTIICDNCLGGIVSHDLGLRFCSPFVNLWIPTNHYIEILQNIHLLKTYSFEDITPCNSSYPIGLLAGKWVVHFMHYKSFEEAVSKWNERTSRMDLNNMYVILVETHSCTCEDMVRFDKLPFKNKIIVAHKSYPEIRSAVAIKNYDGLNKNGEIFRPYKIWGGCLYNQINWVKFLGLR